MSERRGSTTDSTRFDSKAGILDLRDGPAGVAVTTRYLLQIDACAAEMLVVASRRSTDATTATAIS